MITLPEFLDGTTPNCGPTTAHLFDSTHPDHQQQARAICTGCPLRPGCADHALTTPEHLGTWGGLTAQDRRRIRSPHSVTFLDAEGRVRVPCGTYKALQAHLRYDEECAECRDAQAARTLAQRRARLAEEHELGGTFTGAAIHRRIGEPVCLHCRAAEARRSAVAREVRRLGAQHRELAAAS
ncbi:WhiB family transcriptional regulator [Streptomyces sp. NPDC051840]|uniref:WhiB family transcriptional regulator n=1 Tax=Streptomyces sp. NPDC051840 TaxID=3154752 RepID=UPI0034231EC1